MNLQSMLTELKQRGFSDNEIARRLTARGVAVSQPTISRLRNGVHGSTTYEVGKGIEKLFDECSLEKKAASKAA